MANIEKRHIINRHNLSGEFYFTSILQEAYSCGLLSDSDLENIQIQCVSLLAYKTERYNMGKSSSIRVETAESIMKSNFYSIGLYLKTLPDPDDAVFELKTVNISELYERGRKLINIKFKTARHIYNIVQKNRLDTPNHSYNSTLGEDGIGIFFKSYNIEYKAHDCSASIDYQLCNPVNDLAGVEFIQKYIENLYFENDFCKNFDNERIHHLLSGYDENYAELLINIFEQVLTAALGCSLADRSIRELSITEEDIWRLYEKLKKYDNDTLMMAINSAVNHIYEELNITNHSLKGYIEKKFAKDCNEYRDCAKIKYSR
ncbi:DUF6179 domain-containing protein [Acetivibrio straminisolvens]|uniref:Uncharacterized protein n=1 Tax=Acetivibrio straminisolvens JCM 21531 TaxID=1294263 RepID=W4VCI4_9FIRM|nr:DUF6179 domain-containing protein [Acetivibrio straminisolvens]GAE90498.1 hypothetical protein JCM21531_4115 [Acetivibrio straminisolvens JCM 21531]